MANTETKSGSPKSAVVYHVAFAAPRKLFVLGENEDGTLNIGTEDGKLVVAKCPVAKEKLHGHCTRNLKDLVVAGDEKPEEQFPEMK